MPGGCRACCGSWRRCRRWPAPPPPRRRPHRPRRDAAAGRVPDEADRVRDQGRAALPRRPPRPAVRGFSPSCFSPSVRRFCSARTKTSEGVGGSITRFGCASGTGSDGPGSGPYSENLCARRPAAGVDPGHRLMRPIRRAPLCPSRFRGSSPPVSHRFAAVELVDVGSGRMVAGVRTSPSWPGCRCRRSIGGSSGTPRTGWPVCRMVRMPRRASRCRVGYADGFSR
jgi:hypothetical protein